MWRYLREFLSDKRVIEVQKEDMDSNIIFIILIFRPKKSGKMYEKIWNRKKDLSPLKEITIKIRDKVSKRLQKSDS